MANPVTVTSDHHLKSDCDMVRAVVSLKSMLTVATLCLSYCILGDGICDCSRGTMRRRPAILSIDLLEI